MKVRDLIALLAQQDPEMEVILDQYSDYTTADCVNVIKAVPHGCYMMRPHYSMSAENVSKLTSYVHIS